MATLFILIGLLPNLLCELPATRVELSKQTTFITEPLADDELPNYALAIYEKSREGIVPEKNGAIEFWRAMGPGELDEVMFDRLASEIGLSSPKKSNPEFTLSETSLREVVTAWLRKPDDEVSMDQLAEQVDRYLEWASQNPWTERQIPPLAKWISDHRDAFELLEIASSKPQFYSPYAQMLVDSNVSVADISNPPVVPYRLLINLLMSRAMLRVGNGDLESAWSDCLTCIRFGNHLAKWPTLPERLMAVNMREAGMKGALHILSRNDVPIELARKILSDVDRLACQIKLAPCVDYSERLCALDYTLRTLTNRLGGMPGEKPLPGHLVNINVILRVVNE